MDYDVIIVDDICSYGGTFYYTLKELRKHEHIRRISLYVSHCEKSVFEGKLYNETDIDMIYTTNSILSKPAVNALDVKRKICLLDYFTVKEIL